MGCGFKTDMEFKLNMVYGDLMWKQENIYSGLLMVNFLYFLGIKVSILGSSLLIGVNFFSKIQGVCQRVSRTLPPSSLICMRHIRPLPLDCHHPDTRYLGIYHRPLRGLTLSVLLSIATTSYHTTCTSLWRLLQ